MIETKYVRYRTYRKFDIPLCKKGIFDIPL